MFNIPQPQINPVEIKARQIAGKSLQASSGLYLAHKELFSNAWDESKVTAQQLCDFMGNEAYKLFAFSKACQDFLEALDSQKYVRLPVPSNRDVVIDLQTGLVTIKMKKIVEGAVAWINQGVLTCAEVKALDEEVKAFEEAQ